MILPQHVAIIMDGNGRWAREKGLPRTVGHRRGAQRVTEIVRCARESGVRMLTLYAFSTENWNRPRAEVSMLMRFMGSFLDKQLPDMMRNQIRFRTIGRRHPLPALLLKKIDRTVRQTKDHTSFDLVLALNYGSRQEMCDGIRSYVRDVMAHKEDPRRLDERTVARYLNTEDMPDPDLLIRTSGEQRISNFLLWQISYAELYFSKKYWPDFGCAEFAAALKEFARRKRRFGKIDA